MCYLWDNYLQIWDRADDIFLMGVGTAYLGVKVLLMARDVKARISGVLNFVDGSLRPVKSETDPDLSLWYKEHSRVYVASDHACWADPELTKRVHRRRFGSVVHSQVAGLANMMQHHFQDVQGYIQESLRKDQGDTTEDDKWRSEQARGGLLAAGSYRSIWGCLCLGYERGVGEGVYPCSCTNGEKIAAKWHDHTNIESCQWRAMRSEPACVELAMEIQLPARGTLFTMREPT